MTDAEEVDEDGEESCLHVGGAEDRCLVLPEGSGDEGADNVEDMVPQEGVQKGDLRAGRGRARGARLGITSIPDGEARGARESDRGFPLEAVAPRWAGQELASSSVFAKTLRLWETSAVSLESGLERQLSTQWRAAEATRGCSR